MEILECCDAFGLLPGIVVTHIPYHASKKYIYHVMQYYLICAIKTLIIETYSSEEKDIHVR